MTKYGIKIVYSNGEEILDEEYDTYEEAENQAMIEVGSYEIGKDVLNMSDPDEWPNDEDDTCDYEIIEVD